MAQNEIHKGDIGVTFKVTVRNQENAVVDLSSATTKNLKFKLPNGSTLTKDTSFFTDGTDGILTYTTVSGDLRIAGEWEYQIEVTISSGSWNTDITNFTVFDNI